MRNDFNKILKEQRKILNLTQKNLADKTGLSEITIRKYEKGERQPKFEQLQKIAEALGVSPYDLLFDSKELAEEVKSIDSNIEITKKLFKHYNFDLPDCDDEEWHYYSVQIRDYLDYLQYVYNKRLKEGE